ncbi:unnamed protein product [Bursaphelenchus xylophilus]|uniref:(pine wood nematode) hypothetical protein n=1 Tax=Bursaphelenchus xylophilus TaxID=6326 RepID=A0A1I7RWC8_BURXY|nr:unnamed protein product [Bursaphelenchus xylophilus]CAG9095470.1 unnamed protein product [Bursaphelenchus xylophilus]
MPTVFQKAQKRPLKFEEQLLAADQPIVKKIKSDKAAAKPVQAAISSKCVGVPNVEEVFHDPTTGRKTGHCAGLGNPCTASSSDKSHIALRDRTVRELEMIFSSNKEVRESQDEVWEAVTRREFGLKLEKNPEETWYQYFKRTETAEEAKLADLAARISAKQRLKQADEKKTKCAEVRPIARRRPSQPSRTVPWQQATLGTIEKRTMHKPEKKKGPTPLMKKAMNMAKRMRR